jgi:hypothetical protein
MYMGAQLFSPSAAGEPQNCPLIFNGTDAYALAQSVVAVAA